MGGSDSTADACSSYAAGAPADPDPGSDRQGPLRPAPLLLWLRQVAHLLPAIRPDMPPRLRRLGIALTLDTAPFQPQLASSRLALASGLGILVMPLSLDVVADASSVSVGWLVVPSMCLIGLALTGLIVRDQRTAAASASAS